jgi:EmrB/QacA subfamily drug resistance transporter
MTDFAIQTGPELTTSDVRASVSASPEDRDDHALGTSRAVVLAIVAVATLMNVLDTTVVTIALPSAQHDLHISVANRQWVVTTYTLAFGGLLLLGGRLADHLGRKRMFVVGLLGFALASALGGLAQDQWMLYGSRGLQGAMAAMMAPAALAILTVTFTEPAQRARAFGVYGAVAGGGSAVGLILGGLLTEYATWRWTLLVNVPVALATAVAATRCIGESRAERHARYDAAGAATVTAGLIALVFGLTRADTHGWGDGSTGGLLASGIGLVALFVVIESRAQNPLLPFRVVDDRTRAGSFVIMGLAAMALCGALLFLTYYLQQTRAFEPLDTGLALVPLAGGLFVAAGGAGRLLPRFGPRPVVLGGLALTSSGLLWLTGLSPDSDLVTHVLAPEVAVGVGLGLVFVAAGSTALIGVDPRDAGVASGLLDAGEQVGFSLGAALLNTVAASATTRYLTAHGSTATAEAAAQVHGFTTAFGVSAAFLAAAFVIALVLVRTAPGDRSSERPDQRERPSRAEPAAVRA